MSGIIPVGYGRAAVVTRPNAGTRECAVTFGFIDDISKTPDQVATAIRTRWLANFLPASMANTWSLIRVEVTCNRSGGRYIGVDGNLSAGTGVQAPPSLAVCALIRKTTTAGGRSGRGRMYMPAGYLNETNIDVMGGIAGADVTALTNRFVAFLTGLTADNISMYLLHASALVGVNQVTSGYCEAQVATQRRRQR